MINRSQFEQDIIKYSKIPFVATARGYGVDENEKTILISQISTTYLKSSYYELMTLNCATLEFKYLRKYIQEPVDSKNSSEFIDYLNKLIVKKRSELRIELSKRY